MRSRRIPMTPAEYELLPREIGWRYEYAAGMAIIRPGHVAAKLKIALSPRKVPAVESKYRPVTPADTSQLIEAFTSGFQETIEYCDCSFDQVWAAGESAVATFFAGVRGNPHPVSCVAVAPTDSSAIRGAALVVQKQDGPFLDMLFIHADYQHQGLGTALVAAVVNSLYRNGESFLGSAYNIGNQPSVAWHTKFGFVEEPDGRVALLREEAARHELRRRELAGDLQDVERERLLSEISYWNRFANAFLQQKERA
jgi:GNAT superfamily N-acetyltransferase